MKALNDVKRTERGWAGHFICANQCRFRRNTLLEYADQKVVVSTVGAAYLGDGNAMSDIGCDRLYETMAFHAHLEGGYWDANVTREIRLKTMSAISRQEVKDNEGTIDNIANDMHENAVTSIAMDMLHDEIENVTW